MRAPTELQTFIQAYVESQVTLKSPSPLLSHTHGHSRRRRAAHACAGRWATRLRATRSCARAKQRRVNILQLVERLVEPFALEQFVVCALVGDASLFEHDDTVGDGGDEVQVVADDQTRLAVFRLLRVLAYDCDQAIALVCVQILRRLIEQENFRTAQEATRQRDEAL